MSNFLQLVVFLTCLGVLVLIAVALIPDDRLFSSFQEDSAAKISMAEIIARRDRLDRSQEALLRRMNTRMQIAEDVIAGGLSLAEAMEQFRALYKGWPQVCLDLVKAKNPGISEDEWDGRRVIVTVRVVLEHRHDEAVTVVARLEKELQELLADRKKRPAAPVAKQIKPSR